MKQGRYTILENKALTPEIFRLVLEGDTSAITVPGQFINIKLDGFFLRRPVSVCDWGKNSLTVIYKILGSGTAAMCGLVPGQTLDVLTGLGNGFDISKSGDRPLVIGGGVGIPPLYRLTKDMLKVGRHPVVILGFNQSSEIFYEEEFLALGTEVIITTMDGSYGIQGCVTDGISTAGDYTYFFACGPTAMLKALNQAMKTSGQFSLEERMGCGFGACMGCTCLTKNGSKRMCKDGPVLEREEVIW